MGDVNGMIPILATTNPIAIVASGAYKITLEKR